MDIFPYKKRTQGIAFVFFFAVRLSAHVSNGCKSLIRPSSGKDTAKTKGVLFIVKTMINARGI